MPEINEEKFQFTGTCSHCDKTSKEYELEQKPFDITICPACYKYICKINGVPIHDVVLES
jgi:NAD-dependent SIR2 family protein deacetylase